MSNRSRFLAPAVVLLLFVAVGCGGEDKKLKVTGIDPVTGDFQGGTQVVISGNRFTKDGARRASVFFGGKRADVRGFQGDGKLLVKTPGGNPNEKVDILIIFEPGGEITLKQAFTYVEPKEVDVKDLDTKTEKK